MGSTSRDGVEGFGLSGGAWAAGLDVARLGLRHHGDGIRLSPGSRQSGRRSGGRRREIHLESSGPFLPAGSVSARSATRWMARPRRASWGRIEAAINGTPEKRPRKASPDRVTAPLEPHTPERAGARRARGPCDFSREPVVAETFVGATVQAPAMSAPTTFAPTVENTARPSTPAPEGMVWIPGGEFSMGAHDPPD